jgi:hypothetical protein
MPRWLLQALPQYLCIALGIALIATVRTPLLERYQKATTDQQTSLLLSPEYSVVFSLGHREALADYLFGTMLVRYGLSFRDKQRDPAAYRYLDTITTLAPTFARPYLYADTMLTMLPTPPGAEDYLATRRLHERGMARLPYHQELALVAGQFAAYIAPGRLPEPYSKEMKLKGLHDLSRACELASNNANIPHACIGVASQLSRSGQREAVIRMLSRTLAVNDDPQIREIALGNLQRQLGERQKDRYAERLHALEGIWKAQMPQVSRNMLSLLGPGPNVWKCAGKSASASAGCETTWLDWAQAFGDDEG